MHFVRFEPSRDEWIIGQDTGVRRRGVRHRKSLCVFLVFYDRPSILGSNTSMNHRFTAWAKRNKDFVSVAVRVFRCHIHHDFVWGKFDVNWFERNQNMFLKDLGWARSLNILRLDLVYLHFAQKNLSIELIFYQIIYSLASLLKKGRNNLQKKKLQRPEILMPLIKYFLYRRIEQQCKFQL